MGKDKGSTRGVLEKGGEISEGKVDKDVGEGCCVAVHSLSHALVIYRAQ